MFILVDGINGDKMLVNGTQISLITNIKPESFNADITEVKDALAHVKAFHMEDKGGLIAKGEAKLRLLQDKKTQAKTSIVLVGEDSGVLLSTNSMEEIDKLLTEQGYR